MLRTIRIILAALFLVGITLLFVGIGLDWWGWMAKLQFLPACLALNAAVIAGVLVLSLVLGRIYCSVICPLGVFQDVVIRIRRIVNPKHHFGWHCEWKWLRYAVLAVFLIALIAGVQVIVALLAPYSAYGRMVRAVAEPVWGMALIVPAVTFVLITVLAWVSGREWCSSVCPVGTVLSLFSRFSLFRPVIDADKCISCRRCEKDCKASCIDIDTKKIDYSRCVDCFDCLGDCKVDALKYRFAYGKSSQDKLVQTEASGPDRGRRAFLAGSALLVGAAARAQVKKNDGGFAPIKDKVDPARSEALVPFGAGSVKDFYGSCTACGLCVSACPNHVLKVSTDLERLMQPYMSYTDGYCRPECNECSKVCPTGAIERLERGQKAAISIGIARVDYDLCVAGRGVHCGNCARHCPSGAIRMVEDAAGHRIPVVNEEQCIGCGACEFLCPSRPLSAITVNGLSVHQSR